MKGQITCQDCGQVAPRRGNQQKYCAECSHQHSLRRKSAWERANPRSREAIRRQAGETVAAMIESGRTRSTASRASIAWNPQVPVDTHQMVRVAVPFDYAASKNAVWRHGRGGHVFARRESVALRAGLAAAIRTTNHRWFVGKLWIDIFVEKPDHKGDAVNVVDLVCDAVKDATGVDDRWYSLLGLDWAIVKDRPRLIVGLRQDVTEDYQACSYCGRILPLFEFGKNRSTASGHARVCRDCSAPKRGRRA